MTHLKIFGLILAVALALAFCRDAFAGGGPTQTITSCDQHEVVTKVGGDREDWSIMTIFITGQPPHAFWLFSRDHTKPAALLRAPINGKLTVGETRINPGHSQSGYSADYVCPEGMVPNETQETTAPPPGWFFSPWPPPGTLSNPCPRTAAQAYQRYGGDSVQAWSESEHNELFYFGTTPITINPIPARCTVFDNQTRRLYLPGRKVENVTNVALTFWPLVDVQPSNAVPSRPPADCREFQTPGKEPWAVTETRPSNWRMDVVYEGLLLKWSYAGPELFITAPINSTVNGGREDIVGDSRYYLENDRLRESTFRIFCVMQD